MLPYVTKLKGNWRVLHQLQTQLHMFTDFMNRFQMYIKTQQFPLHGLLSFLLSIKTHIECLSGYLFYKVCWWEEIKTGVMFYDVDNCRNEESTLQLHHFRSSTLKNEIDMLWQCWDKCNTVFHSSKDLPLHQNL